MRIFANIFDAIAPKFLVAGYFGTPDYINANRDVVRRFATAVLEGDAFANAHPDQTLPWLVELSKVDPDIVKHSRRERFAESIDPALIQTEIDALVRLKLLDRRFNAQEMISPVVQNLRP